MKKIYLDIIFLYILLINLNTITSKNLCPNNPLINVGFISIKNISLITVNENKYKSNLTNEEREQYEEMIDLKQSFSASLDSVSVSFSPEKQSYWDGLNHITLVFFLLSLFPIAIIIIYLLLRFLCKKCSGPRKATDITRFYRNSTWVFMIISTIALFVLYTIILVYSVKINNAVKSTFNRASELIENNEKLYSKITGTIDYFKTLNLATPEDALLNNFKSHIDNYINVTENHTDEIKINDNNRNLGMILLYVYYLIVIILAYLFFFLKLKTPEGILFILVLFTIPAMMVFEGYISKYFFFYSDLCGAINGALYSNEFPIAGQSLGYYYNCFDKQTKAELYGIRFVLYNSAMEAMSEHHQKAIKEYNDLNSQILSPQLNCGIVTEIVPKIEEEFCKDNLIRMYDIIKLMNWLLFVTFLFAIGVRRLENLIWKKKTEIESMIENLEQIY